jgi:hypothetical protein
MKNKIIATLVAFGLVGSASAIEINDNLSVNGFIDGSVNKVDNPKGGAHSGDTADWGLDEVEVNFLLNVGSVSGELHLDNDGGSDIGIEQAHFTYSLENGISLTAGRYGSALGLEGQDPAGLYTYSRAYSSELEHNFNLGDVDSNSVQGLIVSYAAEAWTLQLSIDNPKGPIRTPGDNGKNDLDYEVALSYTGIENMNIGLGFRANDAVSKSGVSTEDDVFNVNATYQVGKALLGAEYTEIDSNNVDLDAMMLLVDYDVSDKLGVALRYSDYDTSGTQDAQKVTIAPNYAITESLGAILEYSDINNDDAGDSDLIALELTYTF